MLTDTLHTHRTPTRLAVVAIAVIAALGAAAVPGQAPASSHREAFAGSYGFAFAAGPISGLAVIEERPQRLRVSLALADARKPLPAIESIGVRYTRGACGRSPGTGVDVELRHVDGRGMEYLGFVQGDPARPYILGRMRSLRVGYDRDGDGAFDDTTCAPVQMTGTRAGWREAVSQFRESRGMPPISSLAVARERRGRLQMRLVLVDRSLTATASAVVPVDAGLARGACGRPAGRTFGFQLEIGGLDYVKALRTPARSASQSVTRQARSLRLVGDLDGDATPEPYCGTRSKLWLPANF